MQAEVPRWGDSVVRGTVRGHPCLLYEHRVRSVGAFLREGRRWRDREYLIHAERRLSFADHEAEVRRAEGLLAERGVGPGDRVAIFAANSAEWTVAFFAALAQGGDLLFGDGFAGFLQGGDVRGQVVAGGQLD